MDLGFGEPSRPNFPKMDSKMRKTIWIPVCLTALLTFGCNKAEQTAQAPSKNTTPVSTGGNAGQPAPLQTAGSKVQSPTDPKEVVRLFFDSMRQGNGAQIEALLSTAAREEIKRKDIVIDPLGSPQAMFQIGESALQKDVMLISSTWSEPEQNGQPAQDLEVVWELRQEAAGWKICGMAVDPGTGEEVQVVNFERLEQEPAPAEQRVASLPNAPVGGVPQNVPAPQNFQGQLPASQGLPAAQGLPPAQGLPEIVPASGQRPPVANGSAGLPAPVGLPPQANLPGNPVRR